jgi:hypothetical protein
VANDVELLISYFALSGDVYPLGPTEVSPFPFKDRVEAAARAGFKGLVFTMKTRWSRKARLVLRR